MFAFERQLCYSCLPVSELHIDKLEDEATALFMLVTTPEFSPLHSEVMQNCIEHQLPSTSKIAGKCEGVPVARGVKIRQQPDCRL